MFNETILERNRDIDDYFSAVNEEKKPELDELKEIERLVDVCGNAHMKLYHKINGLDIGKISDEYLEMFKTSEEYSQLIHQKVFPKMLSYECEIPHILKKEKKDMSSLSSVMGGAIGMSSPLMQWGEVKSSFNNLIEITTFKALISLIGALGTLFFGELTDLLLTVYIVIFAHLIIRICFEKINYCNLWRNIRETLTMFFWIMIAHISTSLVSIKSVPDGGLEALILAWIFATEIKGAIEVFDANAYPVPSVVRKFVKKNSD